MGFKVPLSLHPNSFAKPSLAKAYEAHELGYIIMLKEYKIKDFYSQYTVYKKSVEPLQCRIISDFPNVVYIWIAK